MEGPQRIQEFRESTTKIQGDFDPDSIFHILRDFLKVNKGYYVRERERKEKNEDGKREVVVDMEADRMFDEYSKLFIFFEIVVSGKKIDEKLVKGEAVLAINGYYEWNAYDTEDSPKSKLRRFFEKIYYYYIARQEKGGLPLLDKPKDALREEVSELIEVFRKSGKSVFS